MLYEILVYINRNIYSTKKMIYVSVFMRLINSMYYMYLYKKTKSNHQYLYIFVIDKGQKTYFANSPDNKEPAGFIFQNPAGSTLNIKLFHFRDRF